MSCFSMQNKLPPPCRGWIKGFTSTLQSKLHKLKKSKTIKITTKQLKSTLSTFLGGGRLQPSPAHNLNHSQVRQLHRSFPPVYVDQLIFREPAVPMMPVIKPTDQQPTASKNMCQNVTSSTAPSCGATSTSTSKLRAGSSKAAVLQLPLWGVDDRADKFIAMFYEDMRLQRERSLGEYQEMLARGAM